MHLIVCIKSVVINSRNGVAQRTPDNCALNPFDRPVIEAALQIKESVAGHITALSMGPPTAQEALAEAQAMGVDRAILISDPALSESDTVVTARVLAAAIGRLGDFAAILFGTRSSDSDTGQIGPQTASLLNLPLLSRVQAIKTETSKWHIRRQIDAWEEHWALRPPAVLTIDPRAFTSRPLGLDRIAAAHSPMTIEQWRLVDIGMDPKTVGLRGSPTRVAALHVIKKDRRCRMLEGDPQVQADALTDHLTRAGLIQ